MESSCQNNYNVLDAFTALVEMTNIELKKRNKIKNFSLDEKEHVCTAEPTLLCAKGKTAIYS